MKKVIACLFTIIYLCFTAGQVLHADPVEVSVSSAIENAYSDGINVIGKESPKSCSHLAIYNFHKSHKHLVASRAFGFPRLNFATTSTPIHISSINALYKKTAATRIIPGLSKAPIFINNRVLRI